MGRLRQPPCGRNDSARSHPSLGGNTKKETKMLLTGLEVEAMRKIAEMCRDAQVDAMRLIHALRIRSWGAREIHGLLRMALRFR